MAALVERGLTRTIPRADGHSWLRWGAVVILGDVVIHTGEGTLINEWEGWSSFLGNLMFVLVSGIVFVGLVYGVPVRWALKPSAQARNRPMLVGLPLAVASVGAYAVFFTWAPLLLSPGAVLLGREGLARAREGYGGRGGSIAAVVIGSASFAFGAFLIIYALLHSGDFPFGLF